MPNLDPGLPQDPHRPDHPHRRGPVGRSARPASSESEAEDCPGGTGPIIRIDTTYPADREYPEIPVLDWCYVWPLSLGRAAPGSRRVRWNGQTVPQARAFDGPGALWCTDASVHLVPEWAPKVGVQSGISRMGIHRSGGVTGGSVVLVPRTQLLEVAEYADALLATTGSDDHRPRSGYCEWSLALAGGPTGVWFGVHVESIGGPQSRPGDVRRFAEAVGAPWIVDVRRHDGDDVPQACDRLSVLTGDGYAVYHWDHGEIRLVDPDRIEPRLDPADVRTVHDAAAYVAARRDTRAPWFDLAGD